MYCTKCRKTIRVITKYIDDALTNSLTIANSIVNEIAKVIDNPMFELLLSQLPVGVNTEKVISIITKVLTTSKKVIDCKDLTGIDKVNCLMKSLNLLPKEERNSKLLQLASQLTADLDGKRYTGVVYDTAAQLNYLNEVILSGKALQLDGKERAAEPSIYTAAAAVAANVSQSEKVHAEPVSETPQAAKRTSFI